MTSYQKLYPLILNHKKIIAVYGLGNVGGPLAAAWLRAGAKVIGVDISHELLSEIRKGKSHKKEPFVSETFTKAIAKNNLSITSNGVEASRKSQIKIAAVPVALKRNKIDLKALISVSKDIAVGLKKGDAVIISPSLPPGTCRSLILPILEQKSNLKVERDFYLIYNPERIFEGKALLDIEFNYPAIVAGFGQNSTCFGKELLKMISKKGVLTMASLENAEAEKLFEGVYRDVNIALANELAEYCEKSGVDYWDARKAANSQPFCHLHYPGTGVGGLCIPVYPKFIIGEALKMRMHLKMLEFARSTNDFMPVKCVSDAWSLLRKNKTSGKHHRIAVLGLGFRGEVTDSRLSPTYIVVKEFLKKDCRVAVHDPYITKDDLLPSEVMLSTDLNSVVNKADLIFISSDHKLYSKLNKKSFSKANRPVLIFDGRNILNRKNFKNINILTIGIR